MTSLINKIFLFLILYFILFLPAFSLQTISTQNGVNLSIDHVVVVVPDLAHAIEHFKKMGLYVYSGGTPAGHFDHNAIIPLKDGSYIELYAPIQKNMMKNLMALRKQNKLNQFTQNLNAMDKRFVQHVANGPGFADYALLVTQKSLGKEIIFLKENGLSFTGPISMHRINPEKQKLAWMVGVPKQGILPFLIQDKTARSLRSDQLKAHINDASINQIVIVVHNMQSALNEYESLLGKLNIKKSRTTDRETTQLQFDNFSIILLQPLTQNTNITKSSEMHNEGPYYLELKANNAKKINDKHLRITINSGFE